MPFKRPPSPFKIGDRVRFRENYVGVARKGDVGTVVRITLTPESHEGHYTQIVLDDRCETVECYQRRVEMAVAPFPGDTVRVTLEGKLGKSSATGNWYINHGMQSTPITPEQVAEAEVVEAHVDPIEAALAALPPTADEIAILLGRLSITGTSAAISCPIAEYVKKETGEAVAVSQAGGARANQSGPSTEFHLPQHVRDFIRIFDNGDYPWLTKKAATGLSAASFTFATEQISKYANYVYPPPL